MQRYRPPMKQPALPPLLDSLSSLTAAELLTLRNHAGALLSLKGIATTDGHPASMHTDWILQTLADVMASEGVPVGTARLLASTGSNYKDKRDLILKFLETVDPKRPVKRAILTIGLQLLHHDLADQGITVGPAVMLRNLHRIPATLDKAFPGYAKAGLLAAIVRGANDRAQHTR